MSERFLGQTGQAALKSNWFYLVTLQWNETGHTALKWTVNVVTLPRNQTGLNESDDQTKRIPSFGLGQKQFEIVNLDSKLKNI